MPPDFPAFPSRATPNGTGRIYNVHGRTRCVAYAIDDTETLRLLGATDGIIAYAFVEYDARNDAKRVGHWHGAYHEHDLLEALETMRAALDPTAPRPKHAPLAQLIDERLEPRPQFRIDIDNIER